ncbi:MAG: hypothetical protein E7006_02085 [Alphaproteobacteria bacterium]|nr:hypothetical protein [Alphaproteobacteria bacterium]
MLKRLCVAVSFGLLVLTGASAVELRGAMPVNITSDTAANAKNIAFDEARRQIIADTLRQYADVSMLKSALSDASASELIGLIAMSGIDSEQVSDTTYSADISMTLDADAVRTWLTEKGVQNWLPDDTKQDVFVAFVTLPNGLESWAELKSVARAEQVELDTKHISGNNVRVELPVSKRGAFTIALREAGWRYANQDGNLRVWK